jgi:hypothetical protein
LKNDPKAIRAWETFVKFIAVYPEEEQKLVWIRNNIIENEIKGIISKHLVLEIDELSGRRDLHLSLSVKHIQTELNHLTLKSKSIILEILDIIIQENTIEMKNAVLKAIESVQ